MTKSERAAAVRKPRERRPRAGTTGSKKVAPAKEPIATRAIVDEDDPKLGKVLGFMRLLWGIDHALQSASKRMASNLGVTGLQRLVVRIVGRYPQISAGELASILQVHPSTLTGVFDKLLQRGAIKRTTDPSDARRVLLELTAKGRAIDELRAGTVEAAIRRALASVSDTELEAAEHVLEVVGRELGEEA